MSVEALISQLMGMLPTASTLRTYGEIEIMLPPGIEDDSVKGALAEIASDCGCEIKNQPEYANVKFTKKFTKL
jgi:hypothetical protein